MTETIPNPNPQPRSKRTKRGFARKAFIATGSLVVFLIVTYFVVTSGAFLKSVVLPRVGAMFNAKVSVADASLSPFSSVTLRKLEVMTTGTEPLLKADEVRLRYSLWSIIGGNIKVDEVTVDSPAIVLIQNADGTSNLDPLLPSGPAQPATPPAKAGSPLQLDVKSVALKNARLRYTRSAADGGTDTVQVNGFDLTLKNLKNGATVELALKLDTEANLHQGPNSAPIGVAAGLRAVFKLGLDDQLFPTQADGELSFTMNRASATLKKLVGLNGKLAVNVSPTEVKELALSFSQNGGQLGAIAVSGPFDLNKLEGKLAVTVAIDRQGLNLAGAAYGIDFGGTVINSTNQIVLSRSGQEIVVGGEVNGRSISLAKDGLVTPPLNLKIGYRVALDQAKRFALIETLTLDGAQNDQRWLHGALSKPMRLAWGANDNSVEDSAFKLELIRIDLRDWRAFLGTNVTTGQVSSVVDVSSQRAGKNIEFKMSGTVTNLAARFGDTKVEQANAHVGIGGNLTEFRQLQLDTLTVNLTRKDEAVASLTASGSFDLDTQKADLKTGLDASLPAISALVALPDLQLNTGSLRFAGRVSGSSQSGQQLVVGGEVSGRSISLAMGDNPRRP